MVVLRDAISLNTLPFYQQMSRVLYHVLQLLNCHLTPLALRTIRHYDIKTLSSNCMLACYIVRLLV